MSGDSRLDEKALTCKLQQVMRETLSQELREFSHVLQEEMVGELRRCLAIDVHDGGQQSVRHDRTSERHSLSPNQALARTGSQRFLRPAASAEDTDVLLQKPPPRLSLWGDRSFSKESSSAAPVQVTAPRSPPSARRIAKESGSGAVSVPGALPVDGSGTPTRLTRPTPIQVLSSSENSSVNEVAPSTEHSSNGPDDIQQARALSPSASLPVRMSVLSAGNSGVLGSKRQNQTPRRFSLTSSASKRSKSSMPRHAHGILPVVPGPVPLDSVQSLQSMSYAELNDESFAHLQESFLDDPPGRRGQCHRALKLVAGSTALEYFICTCIIANGFTIGLETEYDIQHLGEAKPSTFTTLGVLFAAVYSLELAIKIGAHGKDFLWGSHWLGNLYDMFVVVCCIASLILERFDSITSPNLACVVLLRLFRLSRILRLIRLCRSMVPLILWTSIVTSLRYMVWVVLLLLFIIYVGGVIVTTMVADHGRRQPDLIVSGSRLEQYYSSLGYSVLSLFQAMTGGVDWDDLVRPLMTEISPVIGVFFSLYICFSVLCVANVITGIFVDSALESARHAKGKELQREVLGLFSSTDADGNGTITWAEFALALGSQSMDRCFRSMDIDPSEARGIFTLLDTEDKGEIDCQEFVSGCLRLRGQARAIDLATLMYFNKRIATWWFQKMQRVEDRLGLITDILQEHLVPPKPGPKSPKEPNLEPTPVEEKVFTPCGMPARLPDGQGRVDGTGTSSRRLDANLLEGAATTTAPSFFATWSELKAEADRRVNEFKEKDQQPTRSMNGSQYPTMSRQRSSRD